MSVGRSSNLSMPSLDALIEKALRHCTPLHADEPGILAFTSKLDRERLQTIFLVHGDLERQEILRGAMNETGYQDVQIPERGETVIL